MIYALLMTRVAVLFVEIGKREHSRDELEPLQPYTMVLCFKFNDLCKQWENFSTKTINPQYIPVEKTAAITVQKKNRIPDLNL